MIKIDGSYGEGGGQIVRTSLALSLVTGKPFSIANIRSGRKKPGLMRQHLTAVNAATEVGNAEVEGHRIGAQSFTFKPQTIKPGCFHYAIGSAGSCSLVLQTVLPALIRADGPSVIILEGGTHNPYAPPFDFLEKAFLPVVGRIGANVLATLERPGFYPAGGGKLNVSIYPAKTFNIIELKERGRILRKSAFAAVSNLPIHISHRELNVVGEKLKWEKAALRAVQIDNSKGPGNILTIEIESENLTEVFTGFGQRGISAEKVADRTVKQVREYLAYDVPVGRYLADQLLIPMAMAGGGKFHTLSPTQHTTTNIEIIKHFLDVTVDIHKYGSNQWEIEIKRL